MRLTPCSAWLFAVLATCPAAASSIITPSPAVARPTANVAISGSGFGASEAVDVYFDTTDTVLLVSSSTGTLSGSVAVPAPATPGAHSITAIGRHSGDAAQATLTVSTAWPKQGFGAANVGVNSYENVLSPSSVPSLGTLWSSSPGATGGTPAVVNNRIYVGTSTGVSSLNAATGAVIWANNLGQAVEASPTMVGTALYIGDLANKFFALNSATGAVLWSVQLDGAIYSSATVVAGIIYVGTANGTFYALSVANKGKVVWSYTAATGQPITTTPAVVGGNVYFAAYTDDIYCLNAASGALVWKYQTGSVIDSSPAVVNGVLFEGSYDGVVYAISTAPGTAGNLQWSYKTGAAIAASPIVTNGTVYVGSGDGNLYALNARTGAANFSLATGGTVRSAAAANGVIYFTTSLSTFFAIDAQGRVLASGSTGTSFLGSPSVSDGRVFVSASSGGVSAMAVNAGTDAIPVPRPASLHPDLQLRAAVRHAF